MTRRFCIADVHGSYKGLIQVLTKANFNYEQDMLICLGDSADGYPEVKEVIEELLKIKNLVYIMGNHDYWLLDYFNNGSTPDIWVRQGGRATLQSYKYEFHQESRDFLNKAVPYYELDDMAFVHGGFKLGVYLKDQDPSVIMWDRTLITRARESVAYREPLDLTPYKKIFIGHTSLGCFFPYKGKMLLTPVKWSNVWCMDTGAGHEGNVSLINIDTEELFVSESSQTLYPGHIPRKG